MKQRRRRVRQQRQRQQRTSSLDAPHLPNSEFTSVSALCRLQLLWKTASSPSNPADIERQSASTASKLLFQAFSKQRSNVKTRGQLFLLLIIWQLISTRFCPHTLAFRRGTLCPNFLRVLQISSKENWKVFLKTGQHLVEEFLRSLSVPWKTIPYSLNPLRAHEEWGDRIGRCQSLAKGESLRVGGVVIWRPQGKWQDPIRNLLLPVYPVDCLASVSVIFDPRATEFPWRLLVLHNIGFKHGILENPSVNPSPAAVLNCAALG